VIQYFQYLYEEFLVTKKEKRMHLSR